MPAGVAFAAMIAVTAFNGLLAWAQDSELLALYAIAGGLITPMLVSTGGNHEITLFSYLLVLDLAVLVLVALRPWSRLLFVAFGGHGNFCSRLVVYFLLARQAPRTAFFLCCFFLIFSLAPRLVHAPLDESGGCAAGMRWPWWCCRCQRGSQLSGLLLPALSRRWSTGRRRGSQWPLPRIICADAASGTGRFARRTRHASLAASRYGHCLPGHGRSAQNAGPWDDDWLAAGGRGAVVAGRPRAVVLVRAFALICLVLGLGALLAVNPPAATRPFLNERFGTYCVAIAVFAFVAWLATRYARRGDSRRGDALANLAARAAARRECAHPAGRELGDPQLLVVFALARRLQLMHDYRMYAQFTYSAFFMLFGAALLAAGSGGVGVSALAGAGAAGVIIAKVFLVDMSS